MRSELLATDLYELTMAASYLARGMTGTATFSCFVRRLPPERGFLVACGLEDVLDHLEGLACTEDDLAALERIGLPATALHELAGLRFSGDVVAVPEGTILAPDEPLLEVTAPIAEAQLVETLVLNQVTYQSAVAAKAARCRIAAGGRIDLVEFGLRRAHGLEAGMAASRAAALAGFEATSNVEAAARYGLARPGRWPTPTWSRSPPSSRRSSPSAPSSPGARPSSSTPTTRGSGVDHAIEAIRRLGLDGQASVRID